MKGVILAGGSGTRLRPLTAIVNKHLLPVGSMPMIMHSIIKLKEAGVHDILIIIGKQSAGLYAELLGSGRELGVALSFRIQDSPGGISEALGLARSWLKHEDKCIVLLGDNLFEQSLQPYIEAYRALPTGALVLLKQVDDPFRYGVPELQDGRIVGIEEKPSAPKSSYCVTGIYMYDSAVFDIIDELEPSKRGELEITDVNNAYARNGTLHYRVLDGWWTDAGTLESLHEANMRLCAVAASPDGTSEGGEPI